MNILNKILFHKERFSDGGNVDGGAELVYFDNNSNSTKEKNIEFVSNLEEAIERAINDSKSGKDRVEVYVDRGHYVGNGKYGEFYYGAKWRAKHPNLPQQHIPTGATKNQESGDNILKYFVPKHQLRVMNLLHPKDEGEKEVAGRLTKIIEQMPHTYQTDGVPLKDKIAYLRYFYGGSDWWVFEKDMGDGTPDKSQHQAYGFACLNGDWQNAEQGYIPISEIIGMGNVELDFHFTSTKFGEILAKNGDKLSKGGGVSSKPDSYHYFNADKHQLSDHQPAIGENYIIVAAYKNEGKYTGWTIKDKDGNVVIDNPVFSLVHSAYNPKKYESGGDVEDKLYSLEVQKEPNGVWEEVNKEKMTKEEAEEMKHDYEKSGIKYHALKIDYPLFASGGEVDTALDYDKLISLYEEFIDPEHKGGDKAVMGILAQGVYSEARKYKMIARAKKATQEAIDKGRYDYKQEVYVHPKGAKTPYLDKYRVTEKFANGGEVSKRKELMNRLGITDTRQFGDMYREWINKVSAEINKAKYVGYKIDEDRVILYFGGTDKSNGVGTILQFQMHGSHEDYKTIGDGLMAIVTSSMFYKEGGGVGGKDFHYIYQKWATPVDGLLGTIRTAPENYWVASILEDGSIKFDSWEKNVEHIDKEAVKKLWESGEIKQEFRSPHHKEQHEKELREKGLKFKDGGIINQYKGKSGETVWDSWDEQQRGHFISDHKIDGATAQVVIPHWDRAGFSSKKFKELHPNLQRIINQHVADGQYAFGGGITDFLKKGVAGAKSGYEATRKFTEDKIHNKKKNIALDVLDETRAKVKTGKEARAVNIATSIVEHEYKNGGKIPKTFTLSEFKEALKELGGDISLSIIRGGISEIVDAPTPPAKELENNHFTIGETSKQISVLKGNENIYVDLGVYDKNNEPFTFHLFSKENKKGLKALVNSLIEKFGCGGKVGKKRKSGKKKK